MLLIISLLAIFFQLFRAIKKTMRYN